MSALPPITEVGWAHPSQLAVGFGHVLVAEGVGFGLAPLFLKLSSSLVRRVIASPNCNKKFMPTEVVLNTSDAYRGCCDGLPPITCFPQRNLRSPAPPVRGFFFRRLSARNIWRGHQHNS